MAKYESIPLELPSEYVQACNGFALDIGCSTAKLIYRSKDDYENGKPKKDELKSDKGRVYLIPSIARTELDDVIELIRTKCDLVHHGDEKTEIMTTGAGCNLFKAKLEEGLNISLNNLVEFDCFIRAFHFLLSNLSEDELFFEPDVKAKEDAAAEREAMRKAHEMLIGKRKSSPPQNVSASDKGPKLPCVIGMCGSGFAYMRVEEDGTWDVLNIAPMAGRMFLGLSALLTGEKDFSDIYSAVDRGSFNSIDEFAHDMVAVSHEEKGGDNYGAIKDVGKPLMPFGKAVTKTRDQIKDDDILHSLYSVWVRNITHLAFSQCIMEGVHNLYFCGNFINNERARYWMTREAGSRWVNKGKSIRLEFIKHGGHLGALGALMKSKK